MCLYPRLIKNRKYTSNKKNKGNIPIVTDERVKLVPIGCQKCIECKKQKAREWQVRLLEDIKTHTNGKFITLTFSNESISELAIESTIQGLQGYQLDNEIATLGTRRFLERWRKKYKKSIRHWLVTELGGNGTENIHLHGIIWTNEPFEEVKNIWKYGYVYPRTKEEEKLNYVNGRTVNYITKYVHKIDEKHKEYKSKILTSAGIGGQYTNSYNSKRNVFSEKNTEETYRTDTGHKIAMPIYWRNKLYTDDEREKLWLQRLDKNERWVCGEKVAADNIEEYNKLLKWHRERNKQLGYGTDEKNWNQQYYELERRRLLVNKRIAVSKTKSKKTLPPAAPAGGG